MCAFGRQMEKLGGKQDSTQREKTMLNIKTVKHINEAKEGEILQVGVGFSRLNFPHDSESLPTVSVKLAFQYL